MASFSADNFIFWCGTSTDGEGEDVGFEDEMPLDEELCEDKSGKGKVRESMYVSLVEGMVNTVLERESFLLSEEELSFFTKYSTLSYKARYLLARLLVRKTGKWYRLDQLKYVSELGIDGILEAMKELCGILDQGHICVLKPTSARNNQDYQQTNIIDLTLYDDDDDDTDTVHQSYSSKRCESLPSMSLSASQNIPPSTNNSHNTFHHFAEDESVATITELLKCLTVNELKEIAKTMKLSSFLTTRPALIDALLASASAQTTLGGFTSKTCSNFKRTVIAKDAKNVHLKQALLSFSPLKRNIQVDVLRKLILNKLKKCIRVNDAINALFHRLHIIYFRSTEHPTSLLTPALLRRCRKRYYAPYTYFRTPKIFTSRDELIAYEDALRMEAAVDMMLEGDIDVELAQQHIEAWANGREHEDTKDINVPPHTLRRRSETPVTEGVVGKENEYCRLDANTERSRSLSVSHEIDLSDIDAKQPVKESRLVANARYVIEVFERVYPRWKQLVHKHDDREARPHGLARFEEGYILTRIVYKGAAAYGRVKDHKREVEILEELLGQSYWRRGKRGAWYDRWALILMHHFARAKQEVDGEIRQLSKSEQNEVLKKAMEIVIRGLHDDDTHIVYRQSLAHRLFRLEKRLKVPENERHECIGKLQKAAESKIIGERIRRPKGIVALDKTANVLNKTHVPVSVQIQGEVAVKKHIEAMKKEHRKAVKEKWTGKSLWYGKDGEDVNVETLVLHHYELRGYKGFHSEASIVCTIWGLLFWDILFSPVPGAFETPYQSAPLDIATECFFFARKDAIEERLEQIKQGKAAEILAETDDKHRETQTMCVGVRWNDFSRQDLIDIVTCLPGGGLSVICRLFCEDYGGRHSGIPDLIVWHMESKHAKFIEVKGPGDNLSENQKVWIDVLLQAGVEVEVCRVSEKEKTSEKTMRKAPKKSKVIKVYNVIDGEEVLEQALDTESINEHNHGTKSPPEDRPNKRHKSSVS